MSLNATNRVHNESLLREKFEFLIAFHAYFFSRKSFFRGIYLRNASPLQILCIKRCLLSYYIKHVALPPFWNRNTAIIPSQPLRNPIPRKGLAIRARRLTLSLWRKGINSRCCHNMAIL